MPINWRLSIKQSLKVVSKNPVNIKIYWISPATLWNYPTINMLTTAPHNTQTDLNKKSGELHQTLISFNIDAQGFRKTKNENPQTQELEVTS